MRLPSEARARDIASGYASMGTHGIGMAQFASTGTITEALLDDIDRVIFQLENRSPALGIYVTDDGKGGWVEGDLGTVEWNLHQVRTLRTYVDAQKVTVWTVGRNTPGYLPESGPTVHLDYADAVTAYVDMLESAAIDIEGTDECECDTDSGELCAPCSHTAHVRAYITDGGVPTVIGGRAYGAESELGITLHAESRALSLAYWVNSARMTVTDYRTHAEA